MTDVRRSALALGLLLAGAACEGGGSDPAPAPEGAPGAGVALLVGETLTNPTTRGIQVSLMPGEPLQLYVEYGVAAAELAARTAVLDAPEGQLAVFTLTDLAPGTRYHYRVRLRRPGQGPFAARPTYGFRTLREPGDAGLRFAYAADSHIAGRWARARCSGGRRAERRLANFERSLAHLLADDVDFVVAGGDHFMIHAPRFESCEASGELGNGSARTQAEADARYRVALSPSLWGAVARSVPFFYVLGNHDGEARFGDAAGSYGHFDDTRELARGARLRHLPDPTQRYPGSSNGDLYYSFVSGDARFIVLDLMAGPDDYPRSAEDWTLGAAQLAWFEQVLARNESPWTFVFSEHLAGGVASPHDGPLPQQGGPPGDYHYGRGGLRATRDGGIRSEFLGEQARLQALMREHGVDVFFHAHDHVAVAGEKKAADGSGEGVYYVLGGSVSGDGRGPTWNLPWFREQMDYDGDGEADFLSEVNGSLRAGFYRVSVIGRERIDLAFITSDAEHPERDGEVAFAFSIFADGSSSLPF